MKALIPDSVMSKTVFIMYTNPRPLPKNLGKPLSPKASINKGAHLLNRYAFYTKLLIPLTLTDLIVGVLVGTTTKRHRMQRSKEFYLIQMIHFQNPVTSSEHLAPSVRTFLIVVHDLIIMHSNQHREVVASHGHMSDRQPPQCEWVGICL